MTPDALPALDFNQSVTLHCKTSSRNVFLKVDTSDSRRRCVPEPVLLREIPYTVQGRVEGVDYTDMATYLVIRARGEAVILAESRGGIRIVGTEVREKLIHVPIGAIVKII